MPRNKSILEGSLVHCLVSVGRVDNERPPNQNRHVNWPLLRMANEDSPEHYNRQQKATAPSLIRPNG